MAQQFPLTAVAASSIGVDAPPAFLLVPQLIRSIKEMINEPNSQWTQIAATDDISDNDVKGVKVQGKSFAVYRIKGKLFVTSDVCTHGNACLSDGYLDGDTIECPLHQGLFHVPSGKAIGAPATEHLATYEIKMQGNGICVRLDQH